MDDIDPRIDALYAGPPALFTKARDALVKELAAEGDRAGAAAARRLRRPSALAAEINRLAREDPERLDALMQAQELLATVQRRMLEGAADADALRAAERAESEAVGAFPGGPPVHAALRFAARSPPLREELRRGVLSSDPSPGDDGSGPFSFGPAPAPPARERAEAPRDELAAARAKRAARRGDADADDAAARDAALAEAKAREQRESEHARRLRLVTDQLDAARAAERDAAAGRDAAGPRAQEAQAETANAVAERDRLRRALADAEERVAAAERDRADADEALAAAQAAADAARSAREAAERAAREALEEASREGSDKH